MDIAERFSRLTGDNQTRLASTSAADAAERPATVLDTKARWMGGLMAVATLSLGMAAIDRFAPREGHEPFSDMAAVSRVTSALGEEAGIKAIAVTGVDAQRDGSVRKAMIDAGVSPLMAEAVLARAASSPAVIGSLYAEGARGGVALIYVNPEFKGDLSAVFNDRFQSAYSKPGVAIETAALSHEMAHMAVKAAERTGLDAAQAALEGRPEAHSAWNRSLSAKLVHPGIGKAIDDAAEGRLSAQAMTTTVESIRGSAGYRLHHEAVADATASLYTPATQALPSLKAALAAESLASSRAFGQGSAHDTSGVLTALADKFRAGIAQPASLKGSLAQAANVARETLREDSGQERTMTRERASP